ncbi:sure-like protein [Dichomitus squalens LYAD-421 SS1]|uniref:Sure-like protein n=1 Tax=Dichomitus squalens (strain LYAD-421) TaxID=732165 RepID=R7SU44_DICSQ|nr:sure-like protein [Dichomitus squalens LYAD-421 SS1]EJF59255.1 sure-like protein [Dichomitus squalens LYAD-421 SS1]
MKHWTSLVSTISIALLIRGASAQNIILTNDDGWAVAQIRAQRDALVDAGFNVVLSAPADNKSGTGSSTATPQPLSQPCEFNTCATGSPAEGFNASDPTLNYVNSFPVDAVRFGIQTLAPEFFGSAPEFVVSGPNVGTVLDNLGTVTQNSGTVGAACEAAKEGIPSAAFSAATDAQISFTTLASSPNSPDTLSALLYAELTANFTRTLLGPAARPILPSGVTLNVNYAATTFSSSGAPNGDCATASDFQWVFTRLLPNSTAVDVETCGSENLPDETTVADSGCFATVTVMNATTKSDVDADVQAQVLDRLTPSGLLTCFT